MSRFTVWVVQPLSYPHARCFIEVAAAVAYSLRKLGHEVAFDPGRGSFITNPLPWKGTRSFGRSIIIGANLMPNIPMPEDAIIFNLEQVSSDKGRGDLWSTCDLIHMLRRHTVWDYSKTNIAHLKTLGVGDIHYCGIGYTPEMSCIEPAPVQDIDILHYGALCQRRVDILNALTNTRIHDADGKERLICVEHLSGVYGEERDRMIARSKVVLNVHQFVDAKIFEIVRVAWLLANKKCVVSEGGGQDPELEAFGKRAVALVDYGHPHAEDGDQDGIRRALLERVTPDNVVGMCVALLDEKYEGRAISAAEARNTIAQRGFEEICKIDQVEEVRRALEASK